MSLWGGRFSEEPADVVFALSRSVHFDWRLAPYDLRSSLAHLAILESSGLLTPDVAGKIRAALLELTKEVSTGVFRNVPLPNWTIKYTGFMRYQWFKDNFKRFSLQHGYRASYNVNAFRSNLNTSPNDFPIYKYVI
jgi:hypothetical protein